MSQNIDYSIAPLAAIEADLGRRIEALRLAGNISQQQLAAEAGVSRGTISRLESGGGVSVETLLRVMRALDIVHRMDALLPEPTVQPIDRVRLKSRRRQRARPRRESEPGQWHWGEDKDDAP